MSETIGYKATQNYVCRNKKYQVGRTYSMKENPVLCHRGFHFCLNAKDVLNYYEYDKDFKLLKVKAIGKVFSDFDKSVTNKIQIIEEITDKDELLKLLGVYKKFDDSGDCIESFEKHIFSNNIIKTYRLKDEKGRLLEERTRHGVIINYVYHKNGLLKTKLINGKVSFSAKFNSNDKILQTQEGLNLVKNKYFRDLMYKNCYYDNVLTEKSVYKIIDDLEFLIKKTNYSDDGIKSIEVYDRDKNGKILKSSTKTIHPECYDFTLKEYSKDKCVLEIYETKYYNSKNACFNSRTEKRFDSKGFCNFCSSKKMNFFEEQKFDKGELVYSKQEDENGTSIFIKKGYKNE